MILIQLLLKDKSLIIRIPAQVNATWKRKKKIIKIPATSQITVTHEILTLSMNLLSFIDIVNKTQFGIVNSEDKDQTAKKRFDFESSC